jgi:hypothetical protein
MKLTCRDPDKVDHFGNCMRTDTLYTECGIAYRVVDMLCMDAGELTVRGTYSIRPIWEITLVEVAHAS